MNISKTMQDAINEQINAELESAYLYLSMSAYFENMNLGGFAKWMRVQFEEEQVHALKFYDYVLQRGGEVELKAISAPAVKWASPLEAFREVQAHEQKVTGLINKLYETALQDKDYASQVLLQWYINEQIEEEKNAAEIVTNLERVEARGTALLMLDHRLGKREDE
jgi:ferritin